MGLFSGSFGTGLVTGLASSIDKSLQTAMTKRDEEMSRARRFWETRQAQKMDLADEHDRRAKKALERFIGEFDGNVAEGLAAYKAVGGSLDAAESYITELDETRKAGISYNIRDKFKFDNIDMGQFTDLSREDALGAVRMEVPELSISMTDTSGLSKIGLGLKDVGKGISEKVNEMIPPRTYDAVEGLEAASFDTSGLKTGVEFAMKRDQFNASMKANSLDLKNQIKFNILEINKLGDSPEDEAERLRLTKENEALFTVYDRFAAIDNRSKGGFTTSTMATNYNSRMSILIEESKYGTVGNQASIVVDGNVLTGAEATQKYNELKLGAQADYVENVLLNKDGTFRDSRAADMMDLLSIPKKALEMAQANINARTEEVTETDDTPPKVDTPPKTDEKPVVTDDKPVVTTDEKPVVTDPDEASYMLGPENNQTEVKESELSQFIYDNPEQYIAGLKELGPEFLVESADNYATLFKTITDNNARKLSEGDDTSQLDAFTKITTDFINSLQDEKTNLQVSEKASSAQRVLTLPESLTITNVTELPDQKGQYLYEGYLGGDTNMPYVAVSSTTPDKAATQTGG